MRIFCAAILLLAAGNPLVAQSYCGKAKEFLTTYKANVEYHSSKNYVHPVLKQLQRILIQQVRNLESSLDNPSLYELNCQRLLEQVRTRIVQLQSAKDTPAPAAGKPAGS